MKNFLSIAALLLASVAYASPDIAIANIVEVARIETENGDFYGEPQSMIKERDEAGVLCTKCIGHHGLCTIGDGSCYPPDGCYFCGGCGADRARCQNPSSEPCQCY